jgi:hypothetical protein
MTQNYDIDAAWPWRCGACGRYIGTTKDGCLVTERNGRRRITPLLNRGPQPRACPHCGMKHTVLMVRPRTDEEARRLIRGED